jgi:hypothetical protein
MSVEAPICPYCSIKMQLFRSIRRPGKPAVVTNFFCCGNCCSVAEMKAQPTGMAAKARACWARLMARV